MRMIIRSDQPVSVAFLTTLCLLLIANAAPTRAQELSYQWEPQQRFSYNMTITVDTDERIITLKGLVHYTVDAANAEQLRLTYRGGLTETSQTKQDNRSSGGPFGAPFGPRGFPGRPGFGPPGSPYARPAFAGKVQTTNRITMTPSGRVLAMQGDSQLPYLLGNVSLLPFETLPKGNQREWTLDSGVSISEKEESHRPFGPFGPQFDQGSESVQAATEVTRYTIQSEKGTLVTIKKSYQLTAPPTGDDEAFDMTGAGTWVFNKQEHLPESLDMAYKLIAKQGNSSTTFPITVKFTRLTPAELEKLDADAKRAQEEQQRKLADEKAKAEAPLTAAEKRTAIEALAGQNTAVLKRTLTELANKSPAERDPDIVGALERTIGHEDRAVREAARKALAKWEPKFQRKLDLEKAYEGPSPVDSTDLAVESTTPLYPGQIVQVQEHGSFWFPARVKALHSDGKVEVEFLTWGKPTRGAILMRRNIQLAPPELDQPDRPQSSSAKMHTWSDASGRFQVAAVFVGLVDDKVRLRREDGRTVDVPLEKLSSAGQSLARRLASQPAGENPFEPK